MTVMALIMTVVLAQPVVGWSAEGAGEKLNLNSATTKELVSLPGIGKAKAEAIILKRKEMGSFKSLDDLLKVKGVGKKILSAIRDLVVLAPAK
jgi:competence protein ComEA